MARLDADKRTALYERISPFYKETRNMVFTAEPFEDQKEEFLLRKYRMCIVLKILHEFNIHCSLNNLPDIINIFADYGRNILDPNDPCEYYEAYESFLNVFSVYGLRILKDALQDTGWEVYCCHDLADFENLPEDILEHAKLFIEYYWGMMKTSNKDYYGYEYYNTHSEKLEGLGFSPSSPPSFAAPYGSIILTNERLRKMIGICENDMELRECKEYKELRKFRDFYLYDNFHVEYYHADLQEKDWKFLCYVFAEELSYSKLTTMHLLNYEAVIFLLLADMVAEEFFEKYDGGKPDGEID